MTALGLKMETKERSAPLYYADRKHLVKNK
jgi:hypothetical protein